MNPQYYEYIFEQLFAAGASDAWIVPIIMKKSRPAATLSVLCDSGLAARMKEIVFYHSTSIGMREYKVNKSMLRREEKVVETEFGKIRVKQSFLKGKLVNSKPEFEDCKKLAEQNKVPIAQIEQAVNQTLQN
jgi:hypothetical protein